MILTQNYTSITFCKLTQICMNTIFFLKNKCFQTGNLLNIVVIIIIIYLYQLKLSMKKTNLISPASTTATQRVENVIDEQKHIFNQMKLQIKQYKDMYVKRNKLRQLCIYQLIQQKCYKAIMSTKNLINLSKSILNFEKNQGFYQYLQHDQFIKTNRLDEQIELLFDSVILLKIYSKMKSFGLIIQELQLINFPTISLIKQTEQPKTKKQLIIINQTRQHSVKYQSILKSIILILSNLNMRKEAIMIYQKYIDHIKSFYGTKLELASACFQFANYLVQLYDPNQPSKQLLSDLKLSQRYFKQCIIIQQKYGQMTSLSNSLFNYALLINILGRNQQALEKIRNAIQIRKCNNQIKDKIYSNFLETYGKLVLSRGEFDKCFYSFSECFQIRKFLVSQKDSQTLKDLQRIQVLIILLFKQIIKPEGQTQKKNKKVFQQLIQLLKQKQFKFFQIQSEYLVQQVQLIKPIKIHLSKQLYDRLTSQQITQLIKINDTISNLSEQKGMQIIEQSKLWEKISHKNYEIFLKDNKFIKDFLI